MRRHSLVGWRLGVVVGLSVLLAGIGVTVGAELELHDNFDTSARIRADQWVGSETRRPNSILEAARFIDGGKLILSALGTGGMRSNRGRRTGSFGLGVKTSGSITTLQAELTVTGASAEACPENTVSTQGRAQLVGFFFNDGSRSATGDLTGDIVAVMEKVVDSQAGYFIRSLVLRCTTWSCHKGEMIKALLFAQSWTLNRADVLRIEWEPLKSQFVFSLNPGEEEVETRRIGYGQAIGPSHPLQGQLQRIRVRHHLANCQSGRRSALMKVLVDDVYLRFLPPKGLAAVSSQAVTSTPPTDRETP